MNEDKSTYWIDIAEYDLETAKVMLTGGSYLYVGFMCHQVIEKALKAVIAKDGTMPPKIHGLVRLAELANLTAVLNDGQKAIINTLVPLNIESRYPEYKNKVAENLNGQICKDIIVKTEALLLWIKSKL